MKRVGAIVLLELCIAALILLLASVATMQMFVRADAMSRETAARTQAMLLAQSCAQRMTASDDMIQTLTQEGFSAAGDALEKQLDDEFTLRVRVVKAAMTAEDGKEACGEIEVACIEVIRAGETLFELPAARYVNKEVIHP